MRAFFLLAAAAWGTGCRARVAPPAPDDAGETRTSPDAGAMGDAGAPGADAGSAGDAGPSGCPALPALDGGPGPAAPLYPAPRFLQVGALGAAATTACVDTQALAAHAQLDALVPELLSEAGLVAPSAEAGACGCDWTLRFAAAPPALSGAAVAAWTAAGSHPERYLAVQALQGGRAEATLYAVEENAALYALRAALALSAPRTGAGRSVAPGTVVDYPSFSWRGMVEGIYGPPNGNADGPPYRVGDRTTILRLMSRLRENIYVYGPKNDPLTRDNWAAPYETVGAGAGQGQIIQVAAHEAKKNLVKFLWAVSPGLSYDFTNPGELGVLTAKLENVRSLGVAHFALFWDDTSNGSAAQVAGVMNQVDDYLKSKDPTDHLLVVGARYCYGPDAYTDTLGQLLHPDIEVMWTGNAVEPTTMTAGDMAAINASLRRKVTIWDNWPNAPGGFGGRSADLSTAVAGYYTNPVLNEYPGPYYPVPTFLAVLGPVADYLWDSTRYSGGASFNRWQPLLSKLEPVVARCAACNPPYQPGWTCNPNDAHSVLYCDGNSGCLTVLSCPGGCAMQPNPHPDVCN